MSFFSVQAAAVRADSISTYETAPPVVTPPACAEAFREQDDAKRQLRDVERRRMAVQDRAQPSSLYLPTAGVAIGLLGYVGSILLEPDESNGAAGIVAIPMLAVGIGSTVWLVKRVRARRRAQAELPLLETEVEPARLKSSVTESVLSNCYAQHVSIEHQLAPPHPLAVEIHRDRVLTAQRVAPYPLEPPIALLSLGYVSSLGLAAGAGIAWWKHTPAFELAEPPTRSERRLMRGLGYGALAAVGLGTIGVGWLIRRIRLRRELSEHAPRAARQRPLPSAALTPAIGTQSFSLTFTLTL